ncbi:MAG: hypothetical protein E7Z92_07175 [Cyanobacteria bacterium SIG31]|nr:hypothetical protein [Cyanobacteria bacterium SIG31]
MWLDDLKTLMSPIMTPLNNYVGVNLIKRETPIIVSISSCRENFKYLPKTIYSLLNQDLKPDRVVLYLDRDFEDLLCLPYEITQFIKNGLEIKFVDHIGSYTKTIYALKDFPNAIVVTAEDGICYSKTWLNNLYLSYIAQPQCINVNQALKIKIMNEKFFLSSNFESTSASFNNLMLDTFGVLYPPKCFTQEVFRKDIFLQQINENAWFWAMALISNRKIRVVENFYSPSFMFNIFCKQKQVSCQKIAESLDKLLVYYKSNLISKLK